MMPLALHGPAAPTLAQCPAGAVPRRRIIVVARPPAPVVPMAQIGFEIDGKEVKIQVARETLVLWLEHFVHARKTRQQQTRSRTLTSLIRAAYRKGVADGSTRAHAAES